MKAHKRSEAAPLRSCTSLSVGDGSDAFRANWPGSFGPVAPRKLDPWNIHDNAARTRYGLAADQQGIAAYSAFAERIDFRFSIWMIGLDFDDDDHPLFDQE